MVTVDARATPVPPSAASGPATGAWPLDDVDADVEPGSGIVLRSTGIVLVIPAVEVAQTRVANLLLGSCRESSGEGGPGAVSRIAAILATEESILVPPFGVVLRSEHGVAVAVRGDVQLTIGDLEGAGGLEVVLSGRGAMLWREVDVDDRARWLRLAPGAAQPGGPAGLQHNLERGTVAGSGVLLRRPNIAPAPAPVVAAGGGTTRTAAALVPPEPQQAAADEGPATETLLATATVVEGAICPRGHFTDPEGRFCTTCGVTMPPATTGTVVRMRPPLGFLVLDGGEGHLLDADLLLGREPEAHDAVRSGRARPLVLNDEVNGVSRVHAHLVVDGWRVTVTDLGSANGTYVDAGDGAWTRLGAGQEAQVRVGARMRVGERRLRVEPVEASGDDDAVLRGARR